MGIKSALKGLFSSKKEDVIAEEVLPTTFSDLKVGNSFTVDICDVMDICGSTFEVKEESKYVINMNMSSNKILTVQSIDSDVQLRATEVIISGNKFIRIDKQMTDDEVVALFMNDDEEDFRHMFTDELTSMFKMKRFALGDNDLIKPLLDWSAEEYKFRDNLGIQGYVTKDGYDETIQYYCLLSAKSDYAVVIESYSDGIAKFYLSHLLAPTNISSIC